MGYRAFISYAHADERWAQWLHRSLEAYRPPKSLGLTDTHPLKPVFRDRDELAASHDLSDAIVTALAESDNLIVICSPTSAQSRWVNAEIAEYAKTGRTDRVFAFIVDGEPNSDADGCLPDQLMAITGREPLAADARPNRDGRRGALLKIAAALLNVGFDDLRQRDHQKRMRRLAMVTTFSSLGMLMTLALAVFALIARQDALDARAEAEDQRAKAVRESEISGQVTNFLIDMFELADPRESRGEEITARELLDRGAAQIEGAFTDEPEIRQRLLGTFGTVYESLGYYEPATKALREAADLAANSGDPERLALALSDLAWLYRETGQYRLSEPLYRRVLAIRREHGSIADIAWAQSNVAVLRKDQGHVDEALALFVAAKALLESDPDAAPGSRVSFLTSIANTLADLGRDAEAIPMYREVLVVRQEQYGEQHLSTAFAHDNLAMALHGNGELAEAEPHYRQALKTLIAVFGPNHPEVAQTQGNVASFLTDMEAYDEAEALSRTALEVHRKMLGRQHDMQADFLLTLSDILLATGRMAEAQAACEEAIEIYANTLGADNYAAVRARSVRLPRIMIRREAYADAWALLSHADTQLLDAEDQSEAQVLLGEIPAAHRSH